MGGCRCTFRGCENSTFTAKQGTHFFHFPVRDMERCTKWAEMSNNMHFLQLPSDKLKNKVVCEMHFRDPCFMNYKKERLIKTAVPTLMRLKSGEICDLEVQSPIEDTVADSEPPAPTRCPVILNRKRPLNPVEKIQFTKKSKDMQNLSDTSSDTTMEMVSTPKIIKLGTKKPILNGLNITSTLTPTSKSASPSLASVTTTSATSTSQLKNQPILLNGNFITTTEGLKYVKKYQRRNKDTIVYDQESQKSYITLENNDGKSNVEIINDPDGVIKIETVERIKINVDRDDTPNSSTAEITNDSINESYLRKMIDEHTKQVEDIKQLLREKLSNKNSESINQNKEYSPRFGEKSVNMNKTQLFNGIKRYLNPSMVALLRMEIFGAPEREWKPDEKQISTELLKLGPDVYEYIRDEWRFRLPPRKDVDNWIKAEDTSISKNDEQDDC